MKVYSFESLKTPPQKLDLLNLMQISYRANHKRVSRTLFMGMRLKEQSGTIAAPYIAPSRRVGHICWLAWPAAPLPPLHAVPKEQHRAAAPGGGRGEGGGRHLEGAGRKCFRFSFYFFYELDPFLRQERTSSCYGIDCPLAAPTSLALQLVHACPNHSSDITLL